MTSATAAVFDLDRTLVPCSSAPVYRRHLAALGLSGAITVIPDALTSIADLFGEMPLATQLERLAPHRVAAVEVATVRPAAEGGSADLADRIPPFAQLAIDEHRDAGRRLVLTTSSPEVLVRPLADRLGFDDVVATEWATAGELFTGGLAGPFVWGRGKLVALEQWAARTKVSLAKSHAYADSYFDTPLLASVGNPVAVNPDPGLALVAWLEGWPIQTFDAPPGVVRIAGRELQELVRPLGREAFVPNARFDIEGLEHIPASGGAIVCANHRSYFDSTVMSMLIAKAGRNGRFLGKKEVFDAPIVGTIARAVGGIRVDRASGSDEPLEQAAQALRAGELVVLMPQGTIPRGPAFFEPELKGRWGAARLAAMSHASVIPVGLWGTERVWPRSSRLPSFNITEPPVITVRVGPPVELEHDDPDADTKRLMTAIADLLPPEAHERHVPTNAELALTYPAGYSGEPTEEAERRPGVDT